MIGRFVDLSPGGGTPNQTRELEYELEPRCVS